MTGNDKAVLDALADAIEAATVHAHLGPVLTRREDGRRLRSLLAEVERQRPVVAAAVALRHADVADPDALVDVLARLRTAVDRWEATT